MGTCVINQSERHTPARNDEFDVEREVIQALEARSRTLPEDSEEDDHLIAHALAVFLADEATVA